MVEAILTDARDGRHPFRGRGDLSDLGEPDRSRAGGFIRLG